MKCSNTRQDIVVSEVERRKKEGRKEGRKGKKRKEKKEYPDSRRKKKRA
jgi:hypothetical protein